MKTTAPEDSASENQMKGLDLILMASGCRLYGGTPEIRLLNLFFRVQCFAVIAYCILIRVYKSPHDPDIVFTLNVSMIQIFALTNLIFLIRRSNRIREVLHTLVDGLTEKEREKMRRMSSLFLVAYVLIGIGSTVLYQRYIIPEDDRIIIIYNFYAVFETEALVEWNRIMTYYLMLFFFAWIRNLWQFAVCCLCYYILTMFHMYDEKMLESVLRSRKVTSISFKAKLEERIEWSNLKEKYNSTFNIFPLLWFTFNFITMISNLVVVIRKKTLKDSMPVETFLICLNLWMTFAICGKITSMSKKISTLAEEVTEHIFSLAQDVNQEFLLTFVREIRCCSGYEFTAFHIFSVRKETVLGFSASLISFTVMFIQFTTNANVTAPNNSTVFNSTNDTFLET